MRSKAVFSGPLLFLALVACGADDAKGDPSSTEPGTSPTGDDDDDTTAPGDDDDDTPTPTAPTDTALPTDTSTPTDTALPTDTGGSTVPVRCTAAVTSVTAAPHFLPTMVALTVETDIDAEVAAWCTADANPDETFFVESEGAGTLHELHLMGLLPANAYTCTAVPVCEPLVGTSAETTYQAGNVPGAIERVSVTVDPAWEMSGAWTLAPFTKNMFGGTTYLVIWGPGGIPRWWMELPGGVGMWVEARFHGDDTLAWGGGMHQQGRARTVDLWDGETWAFAPPGWANEEFHHDGKQLADGRIMTLEIRENSGGGQTWDGFGIRVVDPVTNTVDIDFDSQALVDAGALPPATSAFDNDPWHANWADLVDGPGGEEIWVSLCFERTILVVDAATGAEKYQFGAGHGWTLLDAAGNALGPGALPQCQHGLEVDGDRVLVYDNGQDRLNSSAQEWQLDPKSRTATLLWSWSEPSWKEDYLGDIDYLPDGRVLITEATMFGDGDIVEVDMATGTVVSRMVLDQGGLTYRSDRYDGCDFFHSTSACEALATRHAEVAARLP